MLDTQEHKMETRGMGYSVFIKVIKEMKLSLPSIVLNVEKFYFK